MIHKVYLSIIEYDKTTIEIIYDVNLHSGDKYSRLVRSPPARRRFVQQAVQFLEVIKSDFKMTKSIIKDFSHLLHFRNINLMDLILTGNTLVSL